MFVSRWHNFSIILRRIIISPRLRRYELISRQATDRQPSFLLAGSRRN